MASWHPAVEHVDLTCASVRPALGYWVKEGVGLVVHCPLEDVAKIMTVTVTVTQTRRVYDPHA
jgi:hypothetical protein